MAKVSLSEALRGRTDVPTVAIAARWIRRGWVKANGGGAYGNRYEVDNEVLYQIRALYHLKPYCNASVMAQVGAILQNRHEDPDFIGWLGVTEDGRVVNVQWDTKPIAGSGLVAVINLNRLPPEPDSDGIQLPIPMITPGV